MTASVFQRKEKKYLVLEEQRFALESAALPHMLPDAYGRTLITSVYLDTPSRSIIARSLEKPLYKEKIRIRVYGECEGGALLKICTEGLQSATDFYGDSLLTIPAFVELKKKYKGIVYKRRIRLSLPAAWVFVQGASFDAAETTYPFMETLEDPRTLSTSTAVSQPRESRALIRQIAKEIEAAIGRYEDLEPSMAIFCERTAWAPLDEASDLRITFDGNLNYKDLTAAEPRLCSILEDQESIMEIKAAGAMPYWLVHSLSRLRVYPRSFSKYGAAARMVKHQACACSDNNLLNTNDERSLAYA